MAIDDRRRARREHVEDLRPAGRVLGQQQPGVDPPSPSRGVAAGHLVHPAMAPAADPPCRPWPGRRPWPSRHWPGCTGRADASAAGSSTPATTTLARRHLGPARCRAAAGRRDERTPSQGRGGERPSGPAASPSGPNTTWPAAAGHPVASPRQRRPAPTHVTCWLRRPPRPPAGRRRWPRHSAERRFLAHLAPALATWRTSLLRSSWSRLRLSRATHAGPSACRHPAPARPRPPRARPAHRRPSCEGRGEARGQVGAEQVGDHRRPVAGHAPAAQQLGRRRLAVGPGDEHDLLGLRQGAAGPMGRWRGWRGRR